MSWMLTASLSDPSDDDIELVASMLWDLGTTGLAEADGKLLAGFDTETAARAAATAVAETITMRDTPVTVTSLVVEPYVADWATASSATIHHGNLEFTLDVGAAFGHGGHPTTALCLGLLLEQSGGTGSVLDVGSGTGVLAIAAALSGAAPVTAVENDPDALAVAAGNIVRLGVDVGLHSDLAEVHTVHRVVVANLLLADLRPLAAAIGSLVEEALVLSGFLHEQLPAVIELFPGWQTSDPRTEGEWTALVLSPP